MDANLKFSHSRAFVCIRGFYPALLAWPRSGFEAALVGSGTALNRE
jgi:hypothetical protein